MANTPPPRSSRCSLAAILLPPRPPLRASPSRNFSRGITSPPSSRWPSACENFHMCWATIPSMNPPRASLASQMPIKSPLSLLLTAPCPRSIRACCWPPVIRRPSNTSPTSCRCLPARRLSSIRRGCASIERVLPPSGSRTASGM